jgi:hypothetical protein
MLSLSWEILLPYLAGVVVEGVVAAAGLLLGPGRVCLFAGTERFRRHFSGVSACLASMWLAERHEEEME